MKEVSSDDFGVVIAYLLPGFVVLWGVSYFSPTLQGWFQASATAGPSVGSFLYITLASTAAGLIVSAIRWALIDRLYHWTGIPEPAWRFFSLPEKLRAFMAIVDNHYRYYQFYSNMLVAVVIAYVARLIALTMWPGQSGWMDVGVLFVVVILVLGSRDTLRKFYKRGGALLEGNDRKQ